MSVIVPTERSPELKSPDTPREQLNKLQEFDLQLRLNLDQAQATVADLNRQIHEMAATGLVRRLFLLGEVFYQEGYEDNNDADTGRAFQATLSVPEGFGAAAWDTEAYYLTWKRGDSPESEARLNNILFADLPPRVQARILPEVRLLMDRFLSCIGAQPWRGAQGNLPSHE